MTPREFMAAMLPEEGWYIIATPRTLDNGNKVWVNVSVETLDDAYTQITKWLWEQRDVYYALASFKEEKVWNKTKKDYRGEIGAWERRTHANVRVLRTFFLDIDAKGGVGYFSQDEALTALTEFCAEVGLPEPTKVSSGYGVHAYWRLSEELEPTKWRAIAEQLKAACGAFGLKADHAVTADIARVLRPVGTLNFKKEPALWVEVLSVAPEATALDISAPLESYLSDKGVALQQARPAKTAAVPDVLGGEGNIGATNDPVNPDLLAFVCPAFGEQVATRGAAATEPQWRAALALARFCEPQEPVLLAVSDGYPKFSDAELRSKMAGLPSGPTRCTTFWKANPETCEACPNWTRISSPAQIAHLYRQAEPLTAEDVPVVPEEATTYIPAPPGRYKRLHDANGKVYIGLVKKNPDGDDVVDVACPIDIYPKRLLRHVNVEGAAEEMSVWMAKLDRVGWTEIRIPNAIFSDLRKMHAFMLQSGIALNPKEAKSNQFMMTAYLKQLHQDIDRERVYDRLGWHENYTAFVVPHRIYFKDGTSREHVPNREVRAVTKNAMHTMGTLQESVDNFKFYMGPGKFAFRFGSWASLGAPLLHMTGHKGVLITAAGDTGRGKSTMLEAGASMWGKPDWLLLGGGQQGSTINAFYLHLGIHHSLPVFWDDTTERNPDEMREFFLNISTGRGKERMHGKEHDGRILTWGTMVISSTNSDDVSRILASGKNIAPHLARLLTLDFEVVDRSTEVKIEADKFKRSLYRNYGWIGPLFAEYVTKNYAKVEKLVLDTEEWFARELNSQSEDRFQTAAIAVTYVAGMIAYKLKLLPFNPQDDVEEFKKRITKTRLTHQQAQMSSAEILSEYLTTRQQNSLVLHAKGASNIDNVVLEPRGPLNIRHELDTHVLYLSRAAFNEYCTEARASFKKIEVELANLGIITRRDCQKVLGAGTKYATSQVRCFEISMTKLNEVCGK